MKKGILIKIFIASLFFPGCRSDHKPANVLDFDSIDFTESESHISPLDTLGEGLPIFYNMYLSVELSSLFESAGAVFKSELMNNTDKVSEYITSSQKAINLGVYAVDLSYAKVFDETETASRYFYVMQQLAKELGIPGEYFENTVQRFERNIADKDSLIYLANEVYVTTERFLKENERYTSAAMIITGGWVEAIYIAVDVAIESKDPEIIERLIDQKYSLNNLMLMLSEHKDNEVVTEYLKELSNLKTEFDKITIMFDIDFNERSPTGKELINKAVLQIREFGLNVSKLRVKMIS
ncbi:MAG: hypothetical protein JW894_00895 [Bacteroidales bacterium]|nr:hypothetical protein [Bacteroidales bacterium]